MNIHILIISFFLILLEWCSIQCFAAVKCYICVWMENTEGISSRILDNCRPGKLNVHNAITDTCSHGCYITMIHEYEPERINAQQISRSNNCSDLTRISSSTNMTMTLFARKCSEKPVIRDHCHITTMAGFRSEERFCNRNHCNGEPNGSSNWKLPLWNIILGNLMFIMYHNDLMSFKNESEK